MTASAFILDEKSVPRPTIARIAAPATPARACAPTPIAVWPPVRPDFSTYRTEAVQLRSQAVTDALTSAGVWLRGRLID